MISLVFKQGFDVSGFAVDADGTQKFATHRKQWLVVSGQGSCPPVSDDIKQHLHRFVSGHDFSRAEEIQNGSGL